MPDPIELSVRFTYRDIPTSGELLNDEFALTKHPLWPFDPSKLYRVRHSFRGRELIGEWEGDGLMDVVYNETAGDYDESL